MKIRAVCTDIDGTLLDSRRQLSARTVSTIKKVGQQMPVILASSRMPSAMRHLQYELGISSHPTVCYNGGYLLDYSDVTPRVVASVGILPSTAMKIFQLAIGTDIHISIFRQDEWTAPREDSWTEREERITKVKSTIAPIEDVLNRYMDEGSHIHKVMCMGPEKEIEWMENRLLADFSSEIHVYRSRSTYLELAPKAISKATGLQVTLQQYGISLEEVMAFGDNYNDIDMLRSVGLGIAVANSREEVKAVAHETTLASVDDGVAFSLEKYLL